MNAFEVSMAVLAGRGSEHAFDLAQGMFHGTAFCLAPRLFVTAAHVYRNARAAGTVALARLAPGRHHIDVVVDAEVFDAVDLALLRCRYLEAELLPCSFEPLPLLCDVACAGYPFGLELLPDEPPMYHLRAFKGYIVTRRALRQLKAAPPGYETSFVPPPGLSGAPLLVGAERNSAVAAVVLGHHRAECDDRIMEVGLAVDVEELLTLDSQIVGGSIAERIFGLPRLTR